MTPHTLFDLHDPEPGQAREQIDVPVDVRRELMLVASRTGISYYYLCAIYRKGRTDTLLASSSQTVEEAKKALHQAVIALAKNDVELEKMIRAVAAASAPPVFPVDQSKVFISVPGPRTQQ